MHCRVCNFDGDFHPLDVVTKVEVETTIDYNNYGEIYNTNQGEVKHHYVTLHFCPKCKIIYMGD